MRLLTNWSKDNSPQRWVPKIRPLTLPETPQFANSDQHCQNSAKIEPWNYLFPILSLLRCLLYCYPWGAVSLLLQQVINPCVVYRCVSWILYLIGIGKCYFRKSFKSSEFYFVTLESLNSDFFPNCSMPWKTIKHEGKGKWVPTLHKK